MKKFILSIFIILLLCFNSYSQMYFHDIILTDIDAIWVDVKAYTGLAAAVTAIGAAERTLYIVEREDFTGTIPGNVRLKFFADGGITSTGAVTINTVSIDAPNKQIFFGTFDYDFASGSEVKTAWFDDVDEAILETVDDEVTLLFSQNEQASTTQPIGDDVALKWGEPGNELTIDSGIVISNVDQIMAGDYIIANGIGRLDFNDGVVVKSTWFSRLRVTGKHIDNSEVTLEVRKSEILDYSYTFPNTVKFDLGRGYDIIPNTGRTLTIQSNDIIGRDYPTFGDDSLGRVDFADGSIIKSTWFSTLADAGFHIDDSIIRLEIRKDETINYDYVFPATTTFKYIPGNILSDSADADLTINGEIDAQPRQQIFDWGNGTGDISLSLRAEVYPQFFGFSSLESGANNATYLEEMITAITANQYIVIPSGSYTIAGQWTLSKACTINAKGAVFSWASDTTADRGLLVTASDVEIDGIELDGPQNVTQVATQVGIRAYGVDSSNYISRLKIRNCKIHDWGYAGIETEFVEKFEIEKNKVYDIFYAGIQLRSSNDGNVDKNKVYDILLGGSPGDNSYGIVITKGVGTEAVKPVCKRVAVTNNSVWNVQFWEGLDAHGGEDISFTGNKVKDCRTGIMVGPFVSAPTYTAPSRCIVANNNVFVDHGASEVITMANTTVGIIYHGNQGGNGLAEGNIIKGNSVRGFKAGLYSRNSQNTVISGNTVWDVYDYGFISFGEDLNIIISDNSFGDIDAAGESGMHFERGAGGNYPQASYGIVANNSISSGALPGIYAGDTLVTYRFIENRIKTTGSTYAGVVDLSDFSCSIIPYLRVTDTWDPASINAAANETHDVTIAGLDNSSYWQIIVGADRTLDGLILSSRYRVANTIELRLDNTSAGAIDLGSLQLSIEVRKVFD